MGYYMDLRDADFEISKENLEPCLEALKKHAIEAGLYGFAWVTKSELIKAENLKDFFKAWRWSFETNEDGDIDSIDFEGEKLGDDEIFFDVLAPFVKDGSYIEMSGEDGLIWRWVFEDGKCRESHPEITWR